MLFRTIRSRLMVTGALVVGSVFALKPSNTVQRIRDAATGRMKDTTVRRVPSNLGLDLQGGIHLSLEVDQSKGPVPDCADAISRAERVVRSRIDQFGTTEPVVQIIGRCRLVVELPGEKDPARAKAVIRRTAFLEFRITGMQNLFRDAIAEIDRALGEAGVRAPGQAGAGAANVAQLFGADTTKGKKGKAPAKGKAAKDTTDLNAPGALSSLLFQSPINMPGEFLVPEEQAPVAESLLARPEVKRLIPRGIELKWGTELASRGARAYRALYAVEDRPIITGEELEKATARRDQVTNQSVVDFVLSRSGGRKFERETGRHVGHYMADLTLDDGGLSLRAAVQDDGHVVTHVAAARRDNPPSSRVKSASTVRSSRARRAGAVGRHRRRRQRADLRAHPRGVAARQARPHGRGRGVQACHERHRRLECQHRPHGRHPLPGRHGPGAGLCRHADYRDRRLDAPRHFRGADLLHDLAAAPAGHGHLERLR